MKGLILCAGKGTRLQPLSLSQPKTLLPVANRPVLFYCIENLVMQGITDIGIVIHPSQQQIRQRIGNGTQFQASISYIYQREPKGIGHAILQARSFIDEEPFVLLLGDNLIMEPLQHLIEAYHQQQENRASIMLAEVENPRDFGIATIKDHRVIKVVEKPEKPESNYAVIGAYVFDPVIFEAVSSISPSRRGEYEISDAIQWLIDQKYPITYSVTEKSYFDVGTIERWLDANRWKLEHDLHQNILIGKDVHINNCMIKGPVVIGDHCHLSNATIGPYVSMESNVTLNGCQVDHSILLEGSHVNNQLGTISYSVFGRKSKLYSDSRVSSAYQLVVGDQSTIKISYDKKG